MKKSLTLEKLWLPIVFLSGIFVFVLALVFSIGQSIWFDEGYSIVLAKSDLSHLMALTAVDAHPPLYYILLKLWGSVWGFSEFALRSLSAVTLSAAIMAMLLLLKRLFSARVALLTLPFILIAPFLIRYGYEVRMYSLALLIGVVATYVLVIAYEKQRWWQWALYALLVAIGMYTLYMTLVIWLAHVVWLVAQSVRAKQYAIWKTPWLYAYGGAVVLFLPYSLTFINQTLHSALPGIGKEVTLTRFVDMVTTLFTYTPEWQTGGWLSLLIIIGTILMAVVGARAARVMSAKEKKNYALIVTIVLVSLTFYAVTSLPPRTPIFVNRYLAHIAIFIYALVGVTLAYGLLYRTKLKTRISRIIPFVAYGVAIAIFAIGLSRLHGAGNFVFERMQHPETQAIRQGITCDKDTMVIATDPYTYIDSVFYFTDCGLRFISDDTVDFKGGYAPLHDSPERVASTRDVHAPRVIVLGWSGHSDPFEQDSRYRLESSKVYGSQRVTTYRLIGE